VNGINLIPTARREAKRRRLRLRRWLAVCIVYAAALTAAAVFCYAAWGADASELSRRIVRTDGQIHAATRAIAADRKALEQDRLRLQANRTVVSQPDWSTLLALVADGLGPEIVLRRCSLSLEAEKQGALPVADAEGPSQAELVATGKEHYVLRLNGLGRSQAAVWQFVLGLEKLQLFDHVHLIRTGREPFLTGKAIAFELHCPLAADGGHRP
jgi:Tfp pilus assembly protein PilN